MLDQEELRRRLIARFDTRGRFPARLANEKSMTHEGLWESIVARSSADAPTAMERIMEVLLRVDPHCPVCGQRCKRGGATGKWPVFGFRQWCSSKCAGIAKRGIPIIRDEAAAGKKRRATMLKKYGYEYNTQRPEVARSNVAKHHATCEERYGHSWAKSIFWKSAHKYNDEHNGEPYPWLALPAHQSKPESEIIDSLAGVGVPRSSIVHGDRSVLNGKEIDIYIPSARLGIEYNGEIWHSSKHRSDKYHIRDKYLAAKAVGIQLINIFGEEWSHRHDQIVNLLQSKLAPPTVRIHGRDCHAAKVDPLLAQSFVESNHIQGLHVPSNQSYGLYHGDHLVAVMVFGLHPRKSDVVTLRRFCCASGVQVIGGASKLLKFAADSNAWKSITSWSDNRWSEGNLYSAMGFTLQHETQADYFYVDNSRHITPKQACKKSKIGARPGQTELERATELGLYRVYDCGKKTWLWTRWA